MASPLESFRADPAQRYLLAVSGGVDSMVMASLFAALEPRPFIALAHCNFHLRGEESEGDAAFVEAWAAQRGLPFHRADFDTLAQARERGISVEMAARELRYGWFAELCASEGIGRLAVAHNLNDKAETLILNLLRGTGLAGLSSMKELSPLPLGPRSEALLFRPLLAFSRAQILDYAKARGISWREDSSNSSSEYKRNFVRNELFPLFERLNPAFLEALDKAARHSAQAGEALEACIGTLRPALELPRGKGELLRLAFGRFPASEGAREWLLHRFLAPYGFTEPELRTLRSLLEEGRSGKKVEGRSADALVSRGLLILAPKDPAGGGAFSEGLLIGGEGLYQLGGRKIKVSISKTCEGEAFAPPADGSAFDAGRLPFPFLLRPWRSGDWLRPIGLKTASGRPGRKKVSDILKELRLPETAKKEILVIAGEDSRVYAVLGHRVDEAVKVSGSTAELCKVEFI